VVDAINLNLVPYAPYVEQRPAPPLGAGRTVLLLQRRTRASRLARAARLVRAYARGLGGRVRLVVAGERRGGRGARRVHAPEEAAAVAHVRDQQPPARLAHPRSHPSGAVPDPLLGPLRHRRDCRTQRGRAGCLPARTMHTHWPA